MSQPMGQWIAAHPHFRVTAARTAGRWLADAPDQAARLFRFARGAIASTAEHALQVICPKRGRWSAFGFNSRLVRSSLPAGERVSERGVGHYKSLVRTNPRLLPSVPLSRLAALADLSPPGRGEHGYLLIPDSPPTRAANAWAQPTQGAAGVSTRERGAL